MVPCGLQTTLDHIFWPSRVSRWPCGQRPHFKDPLPPQPARPLPLSQCGPLCPRDHIRPHFLALREGKSVAMWSETTFLSNPLPLNLLLPPQHVVLDHILPLPQDNVVPCGLQTTFLGFTPLAMYLWSEVVRFPPPGVSLMHLHLPKPKLESCIGALNALWGGG